MAKDFVSDAEMSALESAGKVKRTSAGPDFISDSDMEKLAPSGKPPEPQLAYDEPVGPEQAGLMDRFKERVQDPQRWKAFLGMGPYRNKVIGEPVPLAIPGGAIPKIAKVVEGVNKYALGRVAANTAQGAIQSGLSAPQGETLDRATTGAKLGAGIQVAAEAIPVVGKMVGWAGRKLGSALTGVSEDVIQNYSRRTDEVNALIKSSGGDMTEAADQVRKDLSDGIQNHKSKLNSQISKTLESAPKDKVHPVQSIIEHLEAAKSKLNPNFKSDAINEIEEMIQNIKKEAPDGLTNVQGLYQIKQYLQENASTAYRKGGQIFTRAGEAARAAKAAGAQARTVLKPVAEPIAQADAQLSKLYSIESRLNKNLLAEGKPDSALFAAASGGNKRNMANLRTLEQVSGVPVVQRTKDLASAREFANPSLIPTDVTGKSLTRLAAGASAGALIGDGQGGDWKTGAIIGGTLASPRALKFGINAMDIGRTALTKLNPGLSSAANNSIVQLFSNRIQDANSPHPMKVTPEVEEFFKQNPKLLERIQDPIMKAEIQSRINRKPAQGAMDRRLNKLSK